MKKFYYSLFAAATMLLATTSCSQEEDFAQQSNDLATFSVSLDGATSARAAGDGQTVDKLYYEVYEGDTKIVGDAYDKVVDMKAGKATVEIPLMKGHTYKIAFWAQNSEAGIYDATNLTAIGVNYTNATANNEKYDAFFKAIEYQVKATPTTVELTRPFAQLNVGTTTTDWDTAKGLLQGNDPADKSTVRVAGLANSFNVFEGEASGTVDVTFAAADFIGEDFTLNNVTYKNLAMNYLLVSGNNTDAKTTTTVGVAFKKGDNDVHSFEVLYVPVQRNYRTNIVGNLFTEEGEFEVIVKPGFNEPAILYPELLLAAANGGAVTLTEDVTLDGPLNVCATMVLNIAEGKKLTGSINVAKDANLTVNGGTIENTDDNTSGIVSNGDLTLNDVEITSARHALRIESGNVVINGGIYKVAPTSNKTLYALNVGDGTTSVANVTIKGGTFIGPKGTIADSGGAVTVKEGSTVTIEGGDFSGGKNNTLSNKGTLTVVGGTFDQDPENYVAIDSKVIKVDDKWYVVTDDVTVIAKSAEGMATALTADVKNIKVVLNNDIDLPIGSLGQMTGGSGEYKLGGENTETIEIDLNGKKLNITTTYWSNLGAKNNDALFTIKNGTMTSSQTTGTWNSYDLCFSNCNYVIEDVVFDKAISFGNANKTVSLKNVIINETHDYYAMWIEAVGQTVTIDGLTINSAGRGIKIDEEYVGTPAMVTLGINNATFKTAKKAAIVVKSAAGAEINLSEININGVKEDALNAVWVDEDAAAYADLVIVNGGLKKVEGQDTVLNAENSTITLVENVNYGTLAAGELKNVIIEGAEGTVMIFKTTADTKIENVTLKNVKFEYTGVTADCGIVIDANAQIDNLVVEGCTFTGTGAKAGRCLSGLNNNALINLKSCTFKDLGYPIYAWGSYKALTIESCTFDNIKSWAIMPQSGFDGDLTVTGCTFQNCLGGGLIKAGTLTAGHTFTFTNNTITGCTIAGDHNWFQFNVSAGTSVISGNTKDGAAWTPATADGLK